MANHSRNDAGTNGKNRPISRLGRDLRAISKKIAASGLRPLTRREVAREVAERRGAR